MKTKHIAITAPLATALFILAVAGPAPARNKYQHSARKGEGQGFGIGEEYKGHMLTVEAGAQRPVVAVRDPHFPKVVLSVWGSPALARAEVDRLTRAPRPRPAVSEEAWASLGQAFGRRSSAPVNPSMAGAFAAAGL